MAKGKVDFGPDSKLVLQKAAKGRYTSKLLEDRYQVLETQTPGQFIVVDFQTLDHHGYETLVRDRAGDIRRFSTKTEAEDYCHGRQAAPVAKAIDQSPRVAKTAPREARRSPARAFHELLLAGATDEDAYSKVVAEFGQTSYRPTYPGWYRKQMIKKGLLSA